MNQQSEALRKRTKQFALRIIKLSTSLPNTNPARVIGNQILRSGTSVGANYHEACRARSKAEFISKMGDCLKELSETHYWLQLLLESKIITPSKLNQLITETDELLAVFYTIIKNTQLNQNPSQTTSTSTKTKK